MSSHPLNVILFGQTGHGKSSLINLIAGQEVAKVSSGAAGCTMSFQRYPFLVNGRDVQVWDTVGLDDPDMEITAIGQAYQLIRDWEKHGGVDLLLFCFRAPRITATVHANYRLFHEVLCRGHVPIALAITNLELELDMENWWTRNVEKFERFGLKFAAHVCVTGLPNHEKHTESRRRVWDLLQAHCGDRFNMSSEAWFVESLPLFSFFSSSKKGLTKKKITRILVERCGMDKKKAEEVATKLESRTVEEPVVAK